MKVRNLFITLAAALVVASCAAPAPAPGGGSASTSTATSASPASDGFYDDGDSQGLATTFYFEFDRATLSPQARSALDQHARRISGSIVLEGHADERGSREYNIALGERRAQAVADYLQSRGVSSGMMEIVSYGEERPAVFGSNENAWARNRRVELRQ